MLPKVNLFLNQTEDKLKRIEDKKLFSTRNMTQNVKPKVVQKAYDNFRSQTAVTSPQKSPTKKFTRASVDEEFQKISLDL